MDVKGNTPEETDSLRRKALRQMEPHFREYGFGDDALGNGALDGMELGSGAGTYMGDEVAHDAAPGNPYASIAGQLVGSLAGGMGAGLAARRLASRPTVEPGRTSEVPGAASADRDPVAPRAGEMARAADGREIAIPVDASGRPGVIRTEDGWEALVRVSAEIREVHQHPAIVAVGEGASDRSQ